MAIVRSLLASTRIDRHGDRFSLEALEGMARDFSSQYVPVFLNHDFRNAPVGRSVSAEVLPIGEEQWGLYVEYEIFEPGSEPVAGGRIMPIHAFEVDRVTVVVDRSYRHEEDQLIVRELEGMGAHVETQAKKAVEPLSTLIIAIAAAASAGFFGKLGADAWDALKPKIAQLVGRRRAENREFVVIFERQVMRGENPLIVRVILDSPSPESLATFWTAGAHELESQLARLVSSVPAPVRVLVFTYSDGEFNPSYAIREDCVPLDFKAEMPDGG